ncbi:MAG: DUF4186 domain-containing protein, partial [Planctomycetota bacterium]|nr:DUF4186 domain-containing protein [Planctomycetota bacterium]
MRNMDELFAALGRSKFRSRFRLSGKDAVYLSQKGLETITEHARDFVAKRLADAYPANDGRQTPMKNHPVFVAQHATGTCCRKCLEKWHRIPRGEPLKEADIDYIVEVLRLWLAGQNVEPPTFSR